MNTTNSKTPTALLVMDMQKGILSPYPDQAPAFIQQVSLAIDAARKAHIPIIYVVLSFRDGLPEVADSNRMFKPFKQALAGENMEQWSTIAEEIAPMAGDLLVKKRRVSAFSGSDLEVVLRGLEVKHLVLTGIATSGIVLSTLREAADKDFNLTVIQDACFDKDAEVHRVLMEKVFPRQAEVLSISQWQESLEPLSK